MSEIGKYRVSIVDSLNLRKGPSVDYDVIIAIPKGAKIELMPSSDSWSLVNYNGNVGYVSSKYLSYIDDMRDIESYIIKIVNTSSLNLRKGPSTNQEIIGVLLKNSQVKVISSSNGWSKIIYGNKVGYVYDQYLSDKTTDIYNNTNSVKADKVISYAKSLLGKPYVWADEGPNSFDCSGFTWYVFKNIAKISLPRSSSQQGTYGIYVEKKDLQPADLIFFDTVGVYDKKITHVGMYLGNNEFIHSSSGQGKVVISNLNTSYYIKAYVLARRILK